MTSALEINQLCKTYQQGGKSLDVLKDVSLSLQAGELVALTGASGAGKSTLLQIAGLLDRATSGSVTLDGEASDGLSERKRTALRQSKLGFVYQFHHLMPDFSAIENVALAARISGASVSDARAQAADILARMGLAERLSHMPSELSGGEQQRVAIARALINRPVVLLADEPTGNLDDETSARVFGVMRDLVKELGVAALIATHDDSLAQDMDRRLRLQSGALID